MENVNKNVIEEEALEACDQNALIMNHFKTRGSLTTKQAMREYGIMRLGARISELRADGVNIFTDMVKGVNRYGKTVRYAKYTLIAE